LSQLRERAERNKTIVKDLLSDVDALTRQNASRLAISDLSTEEALQKKDDELEAFQPHLNPI